MQCREFQKQRQHMSTASMAETAGVYARKLVETEVSEMEKWRTWQKEYGYTMPFAPWWKRLPIVRHCRAKWAQFNIERWYAYGPGSIGIRSGYDDWVVFGIWHGLEQPE